MNVSMSPEFQQFVDEKVSSGDYSSASEVIRAGLRLLKERDEEHHSRLDALRRDVSEGLAQLKRAESKSASDVFAKLRSNSASSSKSSKTR